MKERFLQTKPKNSYTFLVDNSQFAGWIKQELRCKYCGITMAHVMKPSGRYVKYGDCQCLLSPNHKKYS